MTIKKIRRKIETLSSPDQIKNWLKENKEDISEVAYSYVKFKLIQMDEKILAEMKEESPVQIFSSPVI